MNCDSEVAGIFRGMVTEMGRAADDMADGFGGGEARVGDEERDGGVIWDRWN